MSVNTPAARVLPDSVVILARAVIKSSDRTGRPVRDPRIFKAAQQPLSTDRKTA